MRTLIVCVSVSHGNTRKVADALADELHAEVVEPEAVRPEDVAEHDLVGFGSGIYYARPHRRLVELLRRLPDGGGTPAFVFATSGRRAPWGGYTRPLERALRRRNYEVVGSFSCRGWDTWLPLRLLGGINRGHPDESDLHDARAFARTIRSEVLARAGTAGGEA